MSAIPNSLATLSSTTPDSALTPATPTTTQASQVNANQIADVVELTQSEQAQQLYNQGQTVPQIAFNLKSSIQAIESYLNISNNSR